MKEYGSVIEYENMKKEIFARGPIACTIDATEKLENWFGWDIFSEFTLFPMPNHILSVVGWGKDP